MLPESLKIVSEGKAYQLYDRLIAQLIQLHQKQTNLDQSQLLVRYLKMSNQSQFQQIDKLKGWLDSFRPLSPIMVAELKKLSDVQFTYNSNAIAYGQQNQDNTNRLLELVLDAAKDSLVETLRLVSTAIDSRGKGMPFYEEMITLLNN